MNFGRMLEEFSEENYSDIVSNLKTGLSKLGFENFDCKIVTIQNLVSGAPFEVNHGLNRVPKYKILLRQIGGHGIVMEDYSKPWTETKAFFYLAPGTSAFLSSIRELTILFM